MMMCSRCKKRPAVVFITTMNGNDKRNEGLCLKCAKELNVPQVNDYIKQLGINEDELEEELDMLFGEANGIGEANDEEDEEESVDGFKSGGAGTIPPFLRNLFHGSPQNLNPQEGTDQSKKKDEHSDKRPEK